MNNCIFESSVKLKLVSYSEKMDPFGNSHQTRVEQIVNNVCREVEQRLQQNEVSPSN